MGFRTTVILYNDQCSEWREDHGLGRKIAHAMNFAMAPMHPGADAHLGYGRVVECVHADTQTLAVLDSYQFHPVLFSSWRRDEPDADRNVRLLRDMAEKLGYRIVKKAVRT